MSRFRALGRWVPIAAALAMMFGFAMGEGARAQQAPNREITLQNETDLAILNFYLFSSNAQDRGADRLGRDTVAPGASQRVRLGRLANCTHDLLVIFQDGTEELRRRVDICRNQRQVYGDPAVPTLDIDVANRSDIVLRELYASARGPDAWGPDRLGTTVIDAGATFRLRLRSRDCAFDIRAVYADDREEVKQRVDLCADRSLVFDRSGIPRPPMHEVALVNRHLAVVQEIYVSLSTDSDWGPDRLNAATLAQGQDATVQVEGGCEVDIRVVFPNGGAEERREMNICETPRIVLAPGWVVERIEETGPAPEPQSESPASGTLRLRNAGALPIVEVYVAPPGATRGADRLGADVLVAGETLEIAAPEGGACIVDLTVVFRDGREVAQPGLDFCQGEEIEVR
jgi:hypothetical protein